MIAVLSTFVQPFASVIVTLYIPAVSPVIVFAVDPVFQIKLNGPAPAVGLTTIDPLARPQVWCTLLKLLFTAELAPITMVYWLKHPLLSVTMRLYVPETRLLMNESVEITVAPSFHTNVNGVNPVFEVMIAAPLLCPQVVLVTV
jgi:hypothetical protein